MKKFRVLSLLSVLAFIMLFTACGGEKKAAEEKKAEPLEIKVSYIFKENEPTHIAMKEATDAINQRLEGQVKFVLFPNGQLPVYKDGLQQVVRGADFIDVDDLSYIGDYVPEFTALAGPMLYQNYDEYVKLMHSDLVADLKKKAEEKGIKIISLDFIFGFRSIISDKEIKEPADLKGMKIRVPASKLFIDTLNAMGASAVPMSFSETISALQQNVIDGLEGSYATNYLTKTYELRKNMSLTKHFLGTAGVYISTKVWDKLTDEQIASLGEEVIRVLKTIYDPEIPVDIYELGLIYDVFINENHDVKILMTLTSPNCPVAEVLPQEVYEKIGSIDEINEVEVELTFDPPWGQEMMSEEAKLELGFL